MWDVVSQWGDFGLRTTHKGSKLIFLPPFTSLPPASISPPLISHLSLHSRAFQTHL